jgi:xylulokinase
MKDGSVLAYDLGTTGNKATLFNLKGQILASAFHEYQTIYPRPGWAEQRPEDWWRSVIATTREVLASSGLEPSGIIGIGISGHMMGCLPVSDTGEPLSNSIIHSDSRSASQCDQIAKSLGEESVYEITGQRLDPHYPLTKAMWVRQQAPEVFAKTRFLLQCKDYVVFLLTGSLGTTDFSDATLTAFFDISRLDWSEDMVEASEIERRLLPEILPSGTIVGHVSARAAAETGLCEGIPVVAGGGDGACATLGAGVAAPGDGYNYVGGTSWVATLLEKADLDPQRRLFSMGAVEFGQFCSIGTMQSAGSSLKWLADEVCREEQQIADREGIHKFDVMDRMARESVAGAHKLFFLPYMMGERAPIWDPAARGTFLGLTLSHSRSDLIRAVLEGVAYALRSILDVMAERNIDVGNLRLIGGGAKSRLWLEIMASVYDRELQIPEHPGEATSLGAALVAGVGVGVYADYRQAGERIKLKTKVQPVADWARDYHDLYAYYRSLYPGLRDYFQSLSRIDTMTSHH